MFKSFALIFGVFLTVIGILGFIPFLTPDQFLFGFLKVNVGINSLHLLTGIIGCAIFFSQRYFQRTYFQIVGFIYAILSVLGFIYGDRSILGFIATNAAENWFHVILTVAFMILGFGTNNILEREKNNE